MSNNLLKAAVCAVLLLASACEKTVPELPKKPQPADLQTITFNLKGFTSAINPLNTLMGGRQNTSSNLPNINSLVPKEQEQFLYFWSFNAENTVPDIALHATQASISFTAADANLSFVTGYGLSPYPAGKALSIKGPKELLIDVSLRHASKVTQLAFDVGSSGTGPKNFSLLFSTDNGTSYQPLSVDNPFENTKDNTRNSYTFDLSLLNDSEHLTLKLEPFAGERGEAKEYNPNTGTFKVDNLRISGIYNQAQPEEPGERQGIVHYALFNTEDHLLAAEGNVPFSDEQPPAITVRLPIGQYYASFVSNNTSTPLLLPTTITDAASWWVSNRFNNHQATVFGTTLPELSIDKNTEIDATLNRYFSEIKFEFSDEDDLSYISKIVVHPLQVAFAYAPFRSPSTYSMEDSTVITLHQPFTQTHKSIQFNQFIGQVDEAVDLAYRVEVYDINDKLLRGFDVNSAIKNNVQLLFKGMLLPGTDKQGQFQIEWNQEWDDTLTKDF